jgi:hypothetical protein
MHQDIGMPTGLLDKISACLKVLRNVKGLLVLRGQIEVSGHVLRIMGQSVPSNYSNYRSNSVFYMNCQLPLSKDCDWAVLISEI